MELIVFENWCTKISFYLLIGLTLLSWSNFILFRKKIFNQSIFTGMVIISFLTGFSLIIHWINTGHIPISNLYESCIFLAWILILLYIVLEKNLNNQLLNVIFIPSCMFIYSFASLVLPKTMQNSTTLVPALQSQWLMMHVTMMMFSYGALLCGSILAIAFLVLDSSPNNIKIYSNEINEIELNKFLHFNELNSIEKTENALYFSKILEKKKTLRDLDYWSSRIISIGFPLLTIGILSGAVWANEAWGSYWSWDPKETWALITWLIFSIYIHTRFSNDFESSKSAWIAALGFFVIWICYLGVNLIGKGLHSYGWFF
uniref:Cytochrome c biogenesis protein CcsA n=1 Tax=Chaetosphaeridium globosum TaxID=96477 RepID=Q8M9U2_CHAGL|nr:cytochrome c biogenesis protein [Chaetosphaeridium globosum]AAM96505.1 protein involved in cytochrome c biogenesis [Chaetosphaeridium globosum]